MPTTQKQRRAAFAELKRRRAGKKRKLFKGMSTAELERYAREPLHKKKRKKRRS